MIRDLTLTVLTIFPQAGGIQDVFTFHASEESGSPSSPARDRRTKSVSQVRNTEIALLESIRRLLSEGRPTDALRKISAELAKIPEFKHAQCVCLMHLGQFDNAVQGLRKICVTPQLSLRGDVPVHFHLTFAKALLLTGNVGGFQSALREIGDIDHPELEKLRAAMGLWEKSLPLAKRLLWRVGLSSLRPSMSELPRSEIICE